MSKPVILCVDDEKPVLDSLKLQLREAFDDKFHLEVAESGEQALDIIEEILDDGMELSLIISDQIMPGLKGDKLLIHVHRVLPDTLKILLTGQASADAVGNAVNKAKLYRYIPKPWEDTDLILTVKEAAKSYMQNKTLEDQNKQLASLVDELKGMNGSLEELVEERTSEIVAQKDEITQQRDVLASQKEEIEKMHQELVDLYEKEKQFMEMKIKNQELENNQQALEVEMKNKDNLRLKAEAEKKATLYEKLQSELNFRNKELTSSALYISQKNELLNKIKEEFEASIEKVNDQTRKQLNRFIRIIKSHTYIENDWEIFKTHFEKVNAGFFDRLKDKFPELTHNDHKFCAYLRIKLSTKEIANLLGTSLRTVESGRYRLRKKLGLENEDNLVLYIQEI